MKGKLFRLLAGCAFALVLLGSFVAAGELAYRVYKGRWYWQERAVASRGMIQPHPYFGACNTPGASEERHGVRISHNSFRGRGSEFERPKPPGRTRLVTLGGSSTYCVGVSDDQTWPFHLNGLLPPNHEVVNLGAPGGTSVEILIQSSLLFSDLQPDVALYYLGWNDARVQHVQNLWPDYSDFHGKWVMSHGLGGREMQSRTAAGYLIHRLAFHYFFPQMDSDVVLRSARGSAGALTDRVDERALGLYERNVGLIAALCRQQGVKPVFIPQVLNYDALTADTPYGWLPFVRDRDLKKVMAVYNERLEKVARREKAAFIHEVLDVSYTPADFVDNGHFSNAGNQRFASAVRKGLERALAEGVK